MVGRIVHDVLEMHGYHPVFFQDPEAALRAFAEANPKPRLVITDFVMSPLNGLELIERCRQIDPQLRTILYSGSAAEDVFKRCPSQPDRFLNKPFLPRRLLEIVREVLAIPTPAAQDSARKTG